MERLELLVSEVESVIYTGQKDCFILLNETLNDLIFYLEARGKETDTALLHIQACCWMLYEEKHMNTDDKKYLTFHYIQNKAFRACESLLKSQHKHKRAA